jgi:protein O-mannosyl-transferase
LWPAQLAVLYPFPQEIPGWKVLASFVIMLGISLLVVRAARRHPYLSVGWLWYLGTLVPVIGLVQVGPQAMADRYTYVPLIGLFVMVAWGLPALLARWRHRVLVLTGAAAFVIGGCTVAARAQLRYWETSITLWQRALDTTAGNFRANMALGSLLEDQGRVSEAVLLYSEALRINPNFPEAHNKLGVALGNQGEIGEAIAHYAEAVRLKPDFAEPHNNLGNAYVQLGTIDEAIAHYNEALRLNPEYAQARNGLGSALDDQGKTEDAIHHYREALRIDPDFAEAHNNLGVSLAKEGMVDEAIREFSESLRIKPDQVNVRNNLESMLQMKGSTN